MMQNDADAFEAFYRAHVHDVERFVARRVADPHLVADLVADIFVAAIESAHTYRPDHGSQAAWLFGIARNLVAAAARSRGRELRAVSRISGRALLDDDSIAMLQERIDAERAAREIYEAMAGLPPGERAVLELVALDGLTLNDVALVLGMKPVTARVRLHRARRALRAALPEHIPSQTPALELS